MFKSGKNHADGWMMNRVVESEHKKWGQNLSVLTFALPSSRERGRFTNLGEIEIMQMRILFWLLC